LAQLGQKKSFPADTMTLFPLFPEQKRKDQLIKQGKENKRKEKQLNRRTSSPTPSPSCRRRRPHLAAGHPPTFNPPAQA